MSNLLVLGEDDVTGQQKIFQPGDTIEGAGGGGGLTWSTVTGNTNAVVNNGYVTNGGGVVEITLPDTAALGSQVGVQDLGGNGWKVLLGSGQNFLYANTTTTNGLQSDDLYSGLNLLCVDANNTWAVTFSYGSFSQILPGVGHGYWAGGDPNDQNSPSNQIDKFTFDTETRSTLGGTLVTARGHVSSTNSSTKGYNGGGATSSTTYTTEIDAVIFSSDTVDNPAAALAEARQAPAGVFSGTTGYWLGGHPLNGIDGIIFSSEAATNPAAVLSNPGQGYAGASSATKGYIGGTTDPVDAFTFSSETIAATSASLALGAWNGAVFDDNNSFWALGSNTMQKLIFSSETIAGTSEVLNQARSYPAGISGNIIGYFGGGLQATTLYNEIDGINFTTETAVNPAATLSVSTRYCSNMFTP